MQFRLFGDARRVDVGKVANVQEAHNACIFSVYMGEACVTVHIQTM
jgi:hypothetical protein